MDPATIAGLLYAGAAFIGAVTALISVVQGVRPADKVKGEGPSATPPGGSESPVQGPVNRLLDQLSLLPKGALRKVIRNGR